MADERLRKLIEGGLAPARELELIWGILNDMRRSDTFSLVRRELEIAHQAVEIAMERAEEISD